MILSHLVIFFRTNSLDLVFNSLQNPCSTAHFKIWSIIWHDLGVFPFITPCWKKSSLSSNISKWHLIHEKASSLAADKWKGELQLSDFNTTTDSLSLFFVEFMIVQRLRPFPLLERMMHIPWNSGIGFGMQPGGRMGRAFRFCFSISQHTRTASASMLSFRHPLPTSIMGNVAPIFQSTRQTCVAETMCSDPYNVLLYCLPYNYAPSKCMLEVISSPFQSKFYGLETVLPCMCFSMILLH